MTLSPSGGVVEAPHSKTAPAGAVTPNRGLDPNPTKIGARTMNESMTAAEREQDLADQSANENDSLKSEQEQTAELDSMVRNEPTA